VTALANHIGVLPKTINEICRGEAVHQLGYGHVALQGTGRPPAILAESSDELGTEPVGREIGFNAQSFMTVCIILALNN